MVPENLKVYTLRTRLSIPLKTRFYAMWKSCNGFDIDRIWPASLSRTRHS